ncbi:MULTISPECIES: tetratricopeptide repeat protein [Flammeovirga]|uniref:Tetratricopeptide repeat protein n=1 Tax=Flammeovirga agarivorans TaxID=2726742 RepID=A0A7X8SIW2_9BACT|nr:MULTISPECIES: tetratricopeptide repeat protein [Flammeovirga]NLR91041.1 tetratricopeptide repeat protein [Flammeovirga agarivorans]
MKKLYSFLFASLILINFSYAQDTSAEDYFVKGEVYAEMGKFNEAIMAYEVAIAKDVDNPKYQYQLGIVYLKTKKTKDALKAFEKATKVDPNYLDAHLKLALLYKEKKDYNKTVEHLDAAYSIVTDSDKKLKYKTRIINILDKTKQFEKAGPHIADAKNINPQDDYILYMDAKYNNYITKNHELAKASMQQAIAQMEKEKGKAHDHYYYELGVAHHSLEDYKNANIAFKEVTDGKLKSKVNTMTPEYQYQIAWAHYQLYDIQKSEEILTNVIKMDPNFEPAYDLLIEIKENSLNRHDIVVLLEHKVSIQPENTQKVKILADLIDLELKFGDLNGANKHIKEFEQCGIPLPDVRLMEGVAAMKAHEYEKSTEILTDLRNNKVSKTSYKANFLLGLVQIKEGQWKEAKMTFSQNYPGEFNVAAREQIKFITKYENSGATTTKK